MVGGYAFRYALEHLAVGRATAIGRCGTLSTLDPDCHAWLKACWIPLRIKPYAQGTAVVIANDPLGLPRRKCAERPQLRNKAFCRAGAATARDVNRFSDCKTTEVIFTGIERHPLLAGL